MSICLPKSLLPAPNHPIALLPPPCQNWLVNIWTLIWEKQISVTAGSTLLTKPLGWQTTEGKFIHMVIRLPSYYSHIFSSTTPTYPGQRHNSQFRSRQRSKTNLPSPFCTTNRTAIGRRHPLGWCPDGGLYPSCGLSTLSCNDWIPTRMTVTPDTVKPHRSRWLCMVVPRPGRQWEGWVSAGMRYDREGNGMARTWLILLSSLLHHPHTYLIAERLIFGWYSLTRRSWNKNTPSYQSPLMHMRVSYSCIPPSFSHDGHLGRLHILVFISITQPRRTDIRTAILVSIPCPCHPERTNSLLHLLRFQRQSLPVRPRKDVRDDVTMRVTRRSTAL